MCIKFKQDKLIGNTVTGFWLVVALIFSSMGCVTAEMWDIPPQPTISTYDENLISFYKTPQNDKVIFLGEQYHYIFNTELKDLNFLLKNKDVKGISFNVNGGRYRVSKDTVHASFSITIHPHIVPDETLKWAIAHNFKVKKADKTPQVYQKTIHLEGKRYRASKEINNKAKRFTQVRHISVTEEQLETSNTLGKIAATPITLAADGVLVVVGVPLLLIAVVLK